MQVANQMYEQEVIAYCGIFNWEDNMHKRVVKSDDSESTNSMDARVEWRKMKPMIVCNFHRELAAILSVQMMLDQLTSISI